MRALLVVAALLLITGCSTGTPPLPNSRESVDDLARAVLAAIERRDVEALQLLALNREEFTTRVWPELPAARPERNLSSGYVWGDLNQKSNITLQQTLAARGGQKYTLVRTQFNGETTEYPSYRVHRESELTVRDASGTEQTIRVFGSVLEMGDRYKVFSYVIND